MDENGQDRRDPAYLEACEQKRRHLEIEAIARDLERSLPEVAELYADLYDTLKSRAQVTDYLPVLVARKVRARYPPK